MKYKAIDSKKFFEIKNQMPDSLAVFLSDYNADEYNEMGATCYLSEDGKSGYAIKPDGDLISVFSLPGAKQGAAAVKSAIKNGAKMLDCIGGFLSIYYRKFGFVEYKRIAWDDQYAPKNWDYDKYDRPDIIFMELKKSNKR